MLREVSTAGAILPEEPYGLSVYSSYYIGAYDSSYFLLLRVRGILFVTIIASIKTITIVSPI